MRTRQLGNSDLNITPLGLGAWAIVGVRHPKQVDGVIQAANLILSPEEVREIEGV